MVDTLEAEGGQDQALPRRARQAETPRRTALLVESTQELSEKLYLGARNLKGVELVLSTEVHPYDLLRYERAIFSKDAIEHAAGGAEEDRIQAQARCRSARRRSHNADAYNVIRRPLITEKGMAVKETESTLVFEVAPTATKTEVKEAVEALFKVKVATIRTASYEGKERRRGKFSGYRPDWKKAYVRLKAGEKMPDYVNNL